MMSYQATNDTPARAYCVPWARVSSRYGVQLPSAIACRWRSMLVLFCACIVSSGIARIRGARSGVLPIARAKNGAIVVCARDPSPILQSALEHAIKEQVILAVTPAIVLERLVRAAYGLSDPDREDEPLPDSPPSMHDIGNFRIEDTPPPRAPIPIAPLEAVLDEIDRVHN